MNIEHYEFGKVKINGEVYTSDIKIICGKVVPDWWRIEGHKLYLDDIKDIISAKPTKIIVGCGASSVMEVTEEVKQYCQQHNIELLVFDTYTAVKYYNNLPTNELQNVALCLHLTC